MGGMYYKKTAILFCSAIRACVLTGETLKGKETHMCLGLIFKLPGGGFAEWLNHVGI